MSRTVHCIKLGKELPGLAFAPAPGDLGTRIYKNVSMEAWQKWLGHQTMLINEKRLSMGNAEHRQYLTQQMQNYFFGGDVDTAEGYRPPDQSSDK